MYYIIAGHGAYAEGCKSSCEMITGAAPSSVPVTFTEDMTKESVEEKYAAILAEKGAKRLNEGRYSGQRVFLIVNKVSTINRLLDDGLKVKEVNIGNMGEKEGRKQIKKSVYCTDAEIAEIENIEKKGVEVYAQMVPNDDKKTFRSYLN